MGLRREGRRERSSRADAGRMETLFCGRGSEQLLREPAMLTPSCNVRRRVLLACFFLWLVCGKAYAGIPTFPLHLIPSPAFAMQDLEVGITRPGCYLIFSNEQYPHAMNVVGTTISYTLPMALGVQPIGCLNNPSTYYFPIGQLPQGDYTVIVYADPVFGDWEGTPEIGRLQFAVQPNHALPQAQTIPSGGWGTRLGLGALVLLLGCLALTGRFRHG